MNLFLRADANAQIGIGHVMRCFALAQAWYDLGGRVTFISDCRNESLRWKVESEGFSFFQLDSVCPDPFDLESTVKILDDCKSGPDDWFVMDGYHFTTEYQKIIYDTGILMMVIDDNNLLKYYYADIILNQNSDAHTHNYHCNEDTMILRGTPYVFLRREFLQNFHLKDGNTNAQKRIFVSLGGGDPDNVTLKVIQGLNRISEYEIEVFVIVGPANVHKESLKSALELSGMKYHLLVNPTNIVELMAVSDMAVSAGGGTYWELAYMGVPTIMITIAENQKAVAEDLGNLGIVINLGWHNSLAVETITESICCLLGSDHERRIMSYNGRKMINGHGTELTISAMKSYRRKGNK